MTHSAEDHLPSFEELDELFKLLDREERDQLLEELLTAAPHGGEAMTRVLNAWILDRKGRAFIDELP